MSLSKIAFVNEGKIDYYWLLPDVNKASEAYLELCQTSVTQVFETVINGYRPSTIFAKKSHYRSSTVL